MKTFSLLLIICISSFIAPQKASAQNAPVDFQVFYDELSPYGTWIDNPNYGYVWIPDVAAGFTPYVTNGNWVLTDDGWTWVSDYSWGWAPFHYGRWFTDPFYGPTWVPDYQWGPGWVTWRRSDAYFGWAPMSPGISFSMSFGNDYHVPNNDWRFVRSNGFGRSDMKNYYVNSSNNLTIINNTTIINNRRADNVHNTTYNAGPDRKDVEKHGDRNIVPIAINENKTPGQSFTNGQLHMYRPEMKNDPNKSKPAPSKFSSVADATTHKQGTVEAIPQHNNQPVQQQPTQSQHKNQPVKQQQPAQPQHNNQPVKQQQPTQSQHNNQPVKQQQPAQSQHNNPPVKQQQPTQPQHSNPPQQHQQTQHTTPPPKQPPTQSQHNNQLPQQQSPTNKDEKKPPHDN